MKDAYLQHLAASYETYPEFDCPQKLAEANEQAQAVYNDPGISAEDRYARLYGIVDQINADLEGQNVTLGEGSVLVNNHAFCPVSVSWEEGAGKAYDKKVPPPIVIKVPVLGPTFGIFEGLVVCEFNEGTADSDYMSDKIYCQIQPIRNEDDVLPSEIPPNTRLLLPLEHFNEMVLLQPTPAVHPTESQLMHTIVGLANIPSRVRSPQHIAAVFRGIVTNSTLREVPQQRTVDWVIDQYNEYLGYQHELINVLSSEAIIYFAGAGDEELHGEVVTDVEIQGQVVGFVDMQNYQKTPGKKVPRFIPYHRPSTPVLGLAITRRNEDDETELVHIPVKSCRKLQIVSEHSEVQ